MTPGTTQVSHVSVTRAGSVTVGDPDLKVHLNPRDILKRFVCTMTNHLAGGPPANAVLGVKSENAYIM